MLFPFVLNNHLTKLPCCHLVSVKCYCDWINSAATTDAHILQIQKTLYHPHTGTTERPVRTDLYYNYFWIIAQPGLELQGCTKRTSRRNDGVNWCFTPFFNLIRLEKENVPGSEQATIHLQLTTSHGKRTRTTVERGVGRVASKRGAFTTPPRRPQFDAKLFKRVT